jgi:hypothetical protein
MKKKKTIWKNKAYNEVSVLDDDGEISAEDLKKIRKFINDYAVDSSKSNGKTKS